MPSGIHFILQDSPNGFKQRRALRYWLTLVAKKESFAIGELSFVLMSDDALLAYNKQYLSHDFYTDVITFDNSEEEAVVAGDILISYDRVKDNANELKVPAFVELRRVMVHGMLHLCGHGDGSPSDKKSMRKLEDKYLALFAE